MEMLGFEMFGFDRSAFSSTLLCNPFGIVAPLGAWISTTLIGTVAFASDEVTNAYRAALP